MFNWLFKKVTTFREKVAVDLGETDVEKPFLDHLDDLRTMIVRMVVTLLTVVIVTFVFIKELIAIITYPLVMAGIADKVQLQNLKVTGGFMTAMNISIVAGVILSFPILLYFLLQFVLPGLRTTEKKVLFPAIAVGGGLFLIGVLFAYYVVAPRALQFFYEFSHDIGGVAAPKQEQVEKPPVQEKAPPAISGVDPERIVKTETTPDGKTIVYFRCCKECTCGMPQDLATAVPPGAPAPSSTPGTPSPTPSPAPAPSSTPAPASGTTPGGAAPAPPGPASPPAETVAAAAAAVPTAAAAVAPFIWELTDYVKFLCQFILIFGLCFELPVVVMALVKLDVLNYKVMKTSRSWAAIIIAVVAAVITPTQDALTLGLLAVPMYLLYELCIWLAWWLEKRDRALYPEYYKEQEEDAKALEVSDDWDNEDYNPWGGGGDDEEDDEDGEPKPKPKPQSPAPPAASSEEAAADLGDAADNKLPPSAESPPSAPAEDGKTGADAGASAKETPPEPEKPAPEESDPIKDDMYSGDEDDWSSASSASQAKPPAESSSPDQGAPPNHKPEDEEPTADKRDTD